MFLSYLKENRCHRQFSNNKSNAVFRKHFSVEISLWASIPIFRHTYDHEQARPLVLKNLPIPTALLRPIMFTFTFVVSSFCVMCMVFASIFLHSLFTSSSKIHLNFRVSQVRRFCSLNLFNYWERTNLHSPIIFLHFNKMSKY